MELKNRAMLENEKKYAYRQSQQICSQTGFIGYLYADLETQGNSFLSTWTGYNDLLKTHEFKEEFDEVINSFREEGEFLHNRKTLSEYCSSLSCESRITENTYGVRVDTDDYAYLFRLNPQKDVDYNVYCFCYKKDWLDSHIKNAEIGIRFITPDYKEIFHINDGESIRIKTRGFSDKDEVCRYIDDYHVEVGNNIFHICEFAERMEVTNSSVIPLRKNLPEYAFVYIESEDCIGRVKKGETGYEITDYGQNLKSPEERKTKAERLNEQSGVSKAQAKAMVAGSMFGWEVSAADPNCIF